MSKTQVSSFTSGLLKLLKHAAEHGCDHVIVDTFDLGRNVGVGLVAADGTRAAIWIRDQDAKAWDAILNREGEEMSRIGKMAELMAEAARSQAEEMAEAVILLTEARDDYLGAANIAAELAVMQKAHYKKMEHQERSCQLQRKADRVSDFLARMNQPDDDGGKTESVYDLAPDGSVAAAWMMCGNSDEPSEEQGLAFREATQAVAAWRSRLPADWETTRQVLACCMAGELPAEKWTEVCAQLIRRGSQ